MGDQGLMQLAAEQGDAVGAGVVAEKLQVMQNWFLRLRLRQCGRAARLGGFSRRRRGLVRSQ
jgi:hypothetical protein